MSRGLSGYLSTIAGRQAGTTPTRVWLSLKPGLKPNALWDNQNGKISEQQWTERFASGRRAAQQALANRNTPAVLGVLFNRIYTLRNQVMHGGATWNSSVNRDQLRDCSNLLGKLVPVIILLMLDNPETLWGDACYPVVA